MRLEDDGNASAVVARPVEVNVNISSGVYDGHLGGVARADDVRILSQPLVFKPFQQQHMSSLSRPLRRAFRV